MDATPPSMAFPPRQTSPGREVVARAQGWFAAVETWLEAEREVDKELGTGMDHIHVAESLPEG